ncbi:MAG: hypothetical protein WKH64_02530 [Chloroflexia bacterium]
MNSRILIILGTLVVLGGLYTLLRPDESAAPHRLGLSSSTSVAT